MNSQTLSEPLIEQNKKAREYEIGIISMGVSLIAAGVFACLTILNVFIPSITVRLMLPGFCVILGFETVVTYIMCKSKNNAQIRVRAGLIFLSIIIILIIIMISIYMILPMHYGLSIIMD